MLSNYWPLRVEELVLLLVMIACATCARNKYLIDHIKITKVAGISPVDVVDIKRP